MSQINIGNIDNEIFKVGSEDCSIYLGDIKLYPKDSPSLKLFETLSGGQTIQVQCNDNPTLTTSETKPSGVAASTITSAEIGDCVTSIATQAFMNCGSLSSVTIPDSVTNIGDSAFRSCSGLTSIIIPSGVTAIGSYTFYGCRNLSSITIPNGLVGIGNYAFNNCRSLSSITIPDSVRIIGTQAFTYCSSLTSITIPDSVTSINNYTFLGCSGLTSITIPSGVTSIGVSAFSQCYGLTSIIIPDAVTTIEHNAFNGCSGLTTCTIGSGVTSIGNGAFYGCTNLTSVTINATTPPTLGSSAFDSTNNCPIYVPCESVDKYRLKWNNYSNRIQGIPPCVETPKKLVEALNNGTFITVECSSDTNLTTADTKPSGVAASAITNSIIGDCVTNIGNNTFLGCTAMTSCKIGSGVTTIGPSAFYQCYKLSSIIIPDSVTNIGGSAFRVCSAMTTCTIGSGVTTIGSYAFNQCKGIRTLTIPDSVTSIENAVFYQCNNLTSINLPSNITEIQDLTFADCSNLDSINIPSGVTRIGTRSFINCNKMDSITVNATTPPTLGISPFDNTNNCPIYVPAESVEDYKAAWSNYASRIQAILVYNSLADIIASSTTEGSNDIFIIPDIGSIDKILVDTTQSGASQAYGYFAFSLTQRGSERFSINGYVLGNMTGSGTSNYIDDANGSKRFAKWYNADHTIVEIDVAKMLNDGTTSVWLLKYQRNCNINTLSFHQI